MRSKVSDRVRRLRAALAVACALVFAVPLWGCGGDVTFTFDANGGTGTMEPMVVERGECVALSQNAFERDGYEFSGWNLEPDGSGRSYEDGQEVIGGFDGTLYAQWREAEEPYMTASPAPADESDEVPEAEVAADAIILEGGVAGDYGRNFTIYGGGSDTDMGTRLGWFVPAGTYLVENLGGTGPWEQVNYGSVEPVVNADGFLESSGLECVLVEPHETVEISVPEGGCIYIVGGSTRLALTRR